MPAIPAEVIVFPILTIFSVGIVVLSVVADEVMECKAVVTGHEIDAGVRSPTVPGVEIGAAS
jgi:hypothetical protein